MTALLAMSRGRDLPGGEHDRVIERDDPADDAERFPHGHVQVLGGGGHGRALDLDS